MLRVKGEKRGPSKGVWGGKMLRHGEKRGPLSCLIILLHLCVFTGRASARAARRYVGCTAQHLESNPSRSDDGDGSISEEKHKGWVDG